MSDRIRTLTGLLRYMEDSCEDSDDSDGGDFKRFRRPPFRSGGGTDFFGKMRQYITDDGHIDIGAFLSQTASVDITGVSPLHVASACGQLETVRFLVEKQHVDPHNADGGHTPLTSAALGGHLNIVKYFIEEQKCNPMCQDIAGRTPLHVACMEGNFDIAKYLISEHDADPAQPDKIGRTSLHLACSDGNIDMVRYLIGHKNVDPNSADMFGETALHDASQNGHVDVVKYLVLQKKCDCLVRRKIDNCAPIHLAALRGSLEVVRFFVGEMRCDPKLEDGRGRSSLHAACQGGSLDIVKYLVDECKLDPCDKMAGSDMTPLHFAAHCGHLDVVRYLVLDKGCNPNCRDKYFDTPLHEASSNGHLDIVKFLIVERKCDPSCKGRFDRTPVCCACVDGCLELVKCLVEEYNVNVSVRDQKGITPLHLASGSKNLELVKYLVAKQCDPHCNENIGRATPLHFACVRGGLDIVRFLIAEQRCDVLAVDHEGDTALHLASLFGHLNIVKYLIDEQKCNPICKGQRGSTPLHAAAQNGHLDVVKYLVENCSVNPNTKNDNGILPLHLAAGKGQMDCVQYLFNYKECAYGKQSSTGPGDGVHGSSFPRQRPDLAAAALTTILLGQLGKEELSIRHPLKTMTVEKSMTPVEDQKPRLAHLQYMTTISGEVEIITTLAPKWQEVGIMLDFDEYGRLVSQIRAQEPDQVLCCKEVFINWLEGRGKKQPATWRVLIQLLQELKLNALVEKIQLALAAISSGTKTKAILKKHRIPKLEPYVIKAVPNGKLLGHGTYGSVEEYKDEHGTVYAGKKLRPDISTNVHKFFQTFSTEFLTLLILKHSHIVQYHAICFQQDSELPVLLMERLETDLHTFLKDSRNSDLAFADKLTILHGVASGLAYLHSQNVVHRDLSAKNVLLQLSPSLTAKISDFGNSCIANIDSDADFEASSTLHGGTILYMPPEHCTPEAKHSTALDIFSFGHLALFVGTQTFPKMLLPSTRKNPRSEVERRHNYFDQLGKKLGTPHPFITQTEKCLDDEPEFRPAANELVFQLTAMMK